jgi:leader peptidase (prepilin peptidase) / N-methyltransferase
MFASPSPSLPLIAALFGVCVGSFLNVVVWRLPRQESLVLPGSHCPRCGTALRWFENLPVLSWLLQAGRCRHCRGPIAGRYPLVELLCAGLWVANSLATPSAMGSDPQPLLLLLAGWLLLSWLIPLTLIDLDQMWLPEPLCRLGLLLGLACTAVLGLGQGFDSGRMLLLHHLLAAAAGLLGFEAVSTVAGKLMGKPALGLGDAKLAALLGAWLGLTGLGLTVLLAVFTAAVVGVLGRITGRLARHQPFPFGPFLTAGGAAVWLLGNGFWINHLGGLLGWV